MILTTANNYCPFALFLVLKSALGLESIEEKRSLN
ncbi:hypothetical protein SLEP1_g53858 [Rubroshorea leprosula]|uniref:Uncharacterized protein n=1 Tax=Rubroshorea leprosula TaxID=152421 RepID=A0AAV5MD00_9ROSI|nr:hypothetical protein SLEP1_g53858 [Rubroshorea leprosula]